MRPAFENGVTEPVVLMPPTVLTNVHMKTEQKALTFRPAPFNSPQGERLRTG